MKKLIGLFKNILHEVKTYWKSPKEGEYLNYKEFTNLIIGVGGCNGLNVVLGYICFAASCFLIGNIYEIPMSYLAVLAVLNIPLSYLMNPINMLITDNFGDLPKRTAKFVYSICAFFVVAGFALMFVPSTLSIFDFIPMPAVPQIIGTILLTSGLNVFYRIFVYKKLSTRFGKFRPWVIAGCIPALLVLALIIYLPIEQWHITQRFWILNLLFSVFNIFNSFSQQTGNIQNIVSPSTEERAKIMSIGAFVYSLFPSIVGILLPILVGLSGGLESKSSYKIIFPIFLVILSAMTLVLAFGVKERVIVEKTHKVKVDFFSGAGEILKNKNYLMLNLSNAAGSLFGGALLLNNIIFVYISRDSGWLGIYFGIIGTACVPGLLLAPWLIKKFGKKKLVIVAKLATLALTIGTYFSLLWGSSLMFIIFNYVSQIIMMPSSISTQAMGADIWDDIQYRTGERMEGLAGIFGMLQTPILALTGLILPAIYMAMGFTSDWNIMYVDQFRIPLVNITVIFGAIATIVSTIPIFFYDLTEKRHKDIIEELKRRAIEKGGLSDADIEAAALAETAALEKELEQEVAASVIE